MKRQTWAMVASAALSAVWGAQACAAPTDATARFGSVQDPVIYGTDDRIEAANFRDPELLSLANTFVGALMFAEYVVPEPGGDYVLMGPTLGQRRALCATEPLLEQPSLAHCTAILAQDNTLITAGHCVEQMRLHEMLFVQGYALGDNYPKVNAAQVHALARILSVRDMDIATQSGQDFAIVQLATTRALPSVRFADPAPAVSNGDPVVVMGTSEGLPLKIEAGGSVFDDAPEEYFEITSDTFEGGSGSPVFTASGTYLGSLVGGAIDYTWDDAAQCLVRSRLQTPETRGELVVRASVLQAALLSGLAQAAPADGGLVDGALVDSRLPDGSLADDGSTGRAPIREDLKRETGCAIASDRRPSRRFGITAELSALILGVGGLLRRVQGRGAQRWS